MLNNLVQCKYSFNVKKQLQLYVTIQLNVNTVLMSKKKNSSISNNSVKHKHAIQM